MRSDEAISINRDMKNNQDDSLAIIANLASIVGRICSIRQLPRRRVEQTRPTTGIVLSNKGANAVEPLQREACHSRLDRESSVFLFTRMHRIFRIKSASSSFIGFYLRFWNTKDTKFWKNTKTEAVKSGNLRVWILNHWRNRRHRKHWKGREHGCVPANPKLSLRGSRRLTKQSHSQAIKAIKVI